jgi:hypothetical protein
LIVAAALEAPAVIAGFDDVAMMGQAIEQCGCHLGVAEHARPFTEGQVGGDDDRCAFIEPADEMEQKLAAGLGERQIAEFVEDDEVHASQMIGEPILPSVAGLGLEPIDEVDHVVEPAAGAGSDAASGEGDGSGSMTSSCLNDQMGKSVAVKRFNSGVSGFGLLIMKASANR